MFMEEALHWKGCCKYSAVGILLSTCFLIQEFVITLPRLRLWRWVFHFYPLLFISWSRINAMNARLWYGTRRLFELLKPCVGLMVVPRHERLVWARKGESACRDLVVHNGYFLTGRDVSLNPVALVRECAESNDANNVRMFIAFKGHPHLLEDFKWVLFLDNTRQLNVLSETYLYFPSPFVNCCECCMVCVPLVTDL